MTIEAVISDPVLSSEDWSFALTVKDGAGVPFDLSSYSIKADFRTPTTRSLVDECSTTNGKISVATNVVTITSYASERTFELAGTARLMADVIAYKNNGSHDISIGLGRLIITVLASTT